MEIERKFTVKELPNLEEYSFHVITQAYLNRDPVMRIRRQDEDYYFTYKSKGLLAREEYNLPLNKESFDNLLPKAEGRIISKKRYLIPYEKYTIELDIFEGDLADFEGSGKPLIIAEVEFESIEEAHAFVPPAWFDEDVTENTKYHNSNLSK